MYIAKLFFIGELVNCYMPNLKKNVVLFKIKLFGIQKLLKKRIYVEIL